jgi:hypothetical protein
VERWPNAAGPRIGKPMILAEGKLRNIRIRASVSQDIDPAASALLDALHDHDDETYEHCLAV